ALELVRPAGRRSQWLCGFAGAALGVTMFKSFGIVFAPVLLAAWIIGRRRARAEELPRLAREIGLTLVGIGATYGAWFVYAAVFGFEGASLSDITPGTGPKDLHTYLSVLQKDWYHALRLNWIDQLWGDFS